MLPSRSRRLVCTTLRATSSERTSCALVDLACTGRYQPMRNSWAIPRASRRSVLTGIADSAALTCRVSKSTVSKPAAVSPACSHCDNGPASRPMRAIDSSCARRKRTSAAGALGTFASRITWPLASTTHTLVSSSDTSSPA